MVTIACSGAVGIARRRGDGVDDRFEQRREVGVVGRHADAGHGSSLASDGGDHREVEQLDRRMQVEEQLLDLGEHLVGPGVVAVDLVEHEHRRQMGGDRLRQDVARLRQRSLGGVDEQQHAVDHGEGALDLAAEVGVPGRVDEVEAHAVPPDRRRLGEDRDAPLALLVVRVEHPVDEVLVGPEDAGGAQHGVDQGGLAVVDVRDERDGAKGFVHCKRGLSGVAVSRRQDERS